MILTQVGFCVISQWPLAGFLSNHKKALLRWFLHLHSNFQLCRWRNIANVTKIIGHTSVNVHRISTKLGTEIHLNEPFTCATFQPDWSTHSCFMADFAKCAKRSRRRKKQRKKTKLWSLVSRKWLERFSSNLECGLPYLAGTSVTTLVSIG